jgi:hypothetical protein
VDEKCQPPTQCISNGGFWFKVKVLSFKIRFCNVDSDTQLIPATAHARTLAAMHPGQTRQLMKESELNNADRERISVDIKLTIILGTLLVTAIVILVGLVPLGLYLFGNAPTGGFVKRGLFVLSFVVLLYIFLTWRNLIKYIDLKNGKKISFRTAEYELKKERDGLLLLTKNPLKLKLDVYDDLLTLIKQSDPLTIEISKFSKTLLFVSQGDENLLERIERENE